LATLDPVARLEKVNARMEDSPESAMTFPRIVIPLHLLIRA
jgi:hypothetical protein